MGRKLHQHNQMIVKVQTPQKLKTPASQVREERTTKKWEFPKSTAHDSFTQNIFLGHRVDKLNHRKINNFTEYVKAQFRGGVFFNAPMDSA